MAQPTTRAEFKEYCLNNKYSKWYFSIIDNAVLRDCVPLYAEKHHIIPKSINGIDENNIVLLTPKEHFICHMLLPKMLNGNDKVKMCLAIHRLIHGNNKNYSNNSRSYQTIKEQHSWAASIRSKKYWNSIPKKERSLMRRGSNNGRYGKPVSDTTRQKISKANKGKLSGKNHPLYKIGHKKESIEKMSKNASRSSAGKKWYHDPIQQIEKYFVENEQPDSFILGRLK